jgi:hypothetical protein
MACKEDLVGRCKEEKEVLLKRSMRSCARKSRGDVQGEALGGV